MRHFKVAELPDIEKALDALNFLLWDNYEPKAHSLDEKIGFARDGVNELDSELADPVDGAGQ
jgi:hypothetical protein